jgi:hypothetical protein
VRVEGLERRTLLAAPFAVGGSPSVHPEDFRVTTFASGLNFPVGMQRLEDGSILVATTTPNAGGDYFHNSVGSLVRLVDSNNDGVADGAPQTLATGLPGTLTSVKQAGKLVFVTSPGAPVQGPASITVLRKGDSPSSAFTKLVTLNFGFPSGWEHVTYALETRRTPGKAGRRGSFDVFFNVGSRKDGETTPFTNIVPITSSDGAFSGTVHGDSIYKITVRDTANGPVFYGLAQVAFGLRNAAGMAIDPRTGDLYFEDNGIDGPGIDPQLSADEINKVAAADIGMTVRDFGFAHDYIRWADGVHVSSGAVQPIEAFPLAPGFNAQGPNDIALSPAAFPPGLNRGVFAAFFGKFGGNAANNQNPVAYADLRRGGHFEFVGNDVPTIGHPVGLISTTDSLFISDMASTGDFQNGAGVIYQVQARPRTFSISGTAFLDPNGNGRRDKGEAGRRGVRIYIDRDGDGALDFGELTAVTRRGGRFAFALPSGRYVVRPVPTNGVSATGKGAYVVKLGRAKTATVNFGGK